MLEIKHISLFNKYIKKVEKVYFRSQILERSNIGEYWNIYGVPVLPENVIFMFLERAGVIQKLTIPEHKNGLVLSNTRVPVSETWSIPFPKRHKSKFCTIAIEEKAVAKNSSGKIA